MQPDLDRVAPDLIALGALVTAFASLVTVHLALAYRLARLGPPWKGFLALMLPPLAPIWGILANLRLLPILWMLSATGYIVALGIAGR